MKEKKNTTSLGWLSPWLDFSLVNSLEFECSAHVCVDFLWALPEEENSPPEENTCLG